VIQDKAFVS